MPLFRFDFLFFFFFFFLLLADSGSGDISPSFPFCSLSIFSADLCVHRPASTISPVPATKTKRAVLGTTPDKVHKPVPSKVANGKDGECTNLLIDDWESQSRLTFLGYNALLLPSSDDRTMKSMVVSNNKVTLTPASEESYFYSSVGCVDTRGIYGGVSLRINAPPGTSFEFGFAMCDSPEGDADSLSTEDLKWTFIGEEQLYSVPFDAFPNLDASQISTIIFTGFDEGVTLGPMAFYCGSQVSEYMVPDSTVPATPMETEPAPPSTADTVLVDDFTNHENNTLGFWHGADDGMSLDWTDGGGLTLTTNDSELVFYTLLTNTNTCKDLTYFDSAYLHVSYSGSNKFSISLQQHNTECNDNIAPFPATWDSLETARYATEGDIYIPMEHFNIDRTHVSSLAFRGFFGTAPTVLHSISFVPSIPEEAVIPTKLPSGTLVFACKRPNSFAFAIDDGDPQYAQQVMEVVKSENIKVTFFTVGLPLEDPSTNLTNVYREMKEGGHQIALHSYTHPAMEGLPDYRAIDWEYNNDIAAVSQAFDGFHTPYFRPPFGVEGARMRQRLVNSMGTNNPYIVMWSVDVEDWLWAETSTPEKQLESFKRDLAKGGNLVVMHYLYNTTVGYLRDFIQLAKATGKDLMRVDQCMMDPNAPPL